MPACLSADRQKGRILGRRCRTCKPNEKAQEWARIDGPAALVKMDNAGHSRSFTTEHTEHTERNTDRQVAIIISVRRKRPTVPSISGFLPCLPWFPWFVE